MTVIHGMRGLGDNIYQRAFLAQLAGPVYLETPWPELYADMPHVLPVRPQTTLRTQLKNIARNSAWHDAPVYRSGPRIAYSKGIIPGMARAFGVEPGPLSLPDFGPSPVGGRYAVVRPVTVRAEWRADARNPLPEYVAEAAEELRAQGYRVVSVADLEPGAEWLVGDAPPADVQYHAGELDVRQLLALVQNAAAVVGGIGWLVPAAIAAQVPAWIICGGQGGYNAPELITDPRLGPRRVEFAVPGRFCRCIERTHNCDKRIERHRTRFASWLRGLPAVV